MSLAGRSVHLQRKFAVRSSQLNAPPVVFTSLGRMVLAALLASVVLAVMVCVAAVARPPKPKPGPPLSYKELVLKAHPVAYWRLGEKSGTTAHDATAHKHNGKYVNRPRLGLSGALLLDRDTSIGLDGPKSRSYVEVPSHKDFSVATSGQGLSVEVWLRTPQHLDFAGQGNPKDGEAPYVHWLGKGEPGRREWAFRFYSSRSKTRPNRLSAYIFNPKAPKGTINLGAGSSFQDKLKPNEWIHIVATYDPPGKKNARVQIYKDGKPSPHNPGTAALYKTYGIVPKAGSSPLRLGTLDFRSFLIGGLDEVAIYPRVLSPQEIARHYAAGRRSKPHKEGNLDG
jgi:hypothetical protein